MQFRVLDAVHFLLLPIVFPGVAIKLIYGQHDSPNYMGCFNDTNGNRTMGEPVALSWPVHYATCLRKCQQDNRLYFGLQFMYECFCGDSYGRLGELDRNKCNSPCKDMKNETCGGANAMDVYSATVNFALGRPTWQSSTYQPYTKYSSSMAVDGNKNTFMHTNCGSNQWWAVDLGNRTIVRKVVLTNRVDCCGNRTRNFLVGLSNTPPADNIPTLDSYTVCGRGPERTSDGQKITVHCTKTLVSTRYVIIQLPTSECLHFSELEVNGELDACFINNGGCSDLCRYTDLGRRCACNTGYTLNNDGSTCEDINECEESDKSNCSHVCENFIGRYMCSCPRGFNLTDDNSTCIDINECEESDRGNCSHLCENFPGSHICSCPKGFNLADDNSTCIDVNECSINNGNCTHKCVNAVGNYQCSCHEGFMLGSDNTSCIAGASTSGGSSSETATIAAFSVVIILLVVITSIVVVVLLLRRQREQLKEDTYSIASLDIDPDKVIYEETTYCTSGLTATGVKLSQLEEHIRLLQENDGFKQQFVQLPRDDLAKCTVGVQPDNKKKNRFVNILPYDDSRVTLKSKEASSADDGYINASYITKYNDTIVSHIATQAPKPETLSDFWLMIWLENVRCIVALVMLFEGGKARCHKYWPDIVGDSSEFGKITVKLDELETFAEYTRRTMSIRIQGAPPKKVIQLQYLVWPDKSTPDDMWSLMAFRRRVRSTLNSGSSDGGPLVVHCSAGVGRTGTFIALDMLLDEVNKSGKVDVFSVVKHLRLRRMMSVQVKDQYILLYNLLLDLYKTGETSMSKSGAHELDKNTQRQKMATEFKLLNQLKPTISLSDDLEALQPLNAVKNRRQDVVPSNKLRASLPPRSDGTDYINAAIATGYKTPAFYLLTQLPLAHTVDDFWQMIVAENITSIVMLDPVTPHDNTTVEFWPRMAGKLTHYGPVNVTLQSTRPYDQESGIVIHTLQVAGKQAGKSAKLDVRIHELTSWTKDQDTPDNVEDVLELIHLVADFEFQQMQQQRQRKRLASTSSSKDGSKLRHVAVMCLDGATRSGLYAATSLTIDRLKCDDEIDVLSSCRYITAARPQAITSLKQYEFVYRAAMRFLSWTPRQLTSVDSQRSPAVYGNSDALYGNVDRGAGNDLNIYANATSPGQSSSDNDDQRLYANFVK